MKFTAMIICVLSGFNASGNIYPIDPRPLRILTQESEFIVIGRVVDLEFRDDEEKEIARSVNDTALSVNTAVAFKPGLALIRVVGVLQGAITDTLIKIPYDPYLICPTPARFTKDTDVILFLDKTDHGFRVHALSYGVKELTSEGIALYTSRIREMQAILKMSDRDQQFLETVEWLVKCCEHRETRWEGTYELSPRSEFMSFYARREHEPFQYLLSAEQKLRLKNALFTQGNIGYGDFGLVDLTFSGNQEAIFELLVKSLRAMTKEDLWFAADYMERIMLVKTNSRIEAVYKKFDDNRFNAKEKQLVKWRNEFLAELDK